MNWWLTSTSTSCGGKRHETVTITLSWSHLYANYPVSGKILLEAVLSEA
jgi:hypothetical protein